MSKTAIAVIAVFAIGVLFVASLAFGLIGFQNKCNKAEIGIEATYQDNQNVYDNGWKRVVELAQVPDQYTNRMKELYHEAMTSRYGPDGSKAFLQFITEQNPTLDADVFKKIQQAIETFRNAFEQAQRELISKKQSYEEYYGATNSGRFYNWVSGWFGTSYPKYEAGKYDIVSSARTNQVFETKQDEPLVLPK